EPERALLLVRQPGLAQPRDGLLDALAVVARRLEKAVVEAHPALVEIAILLIPQLPHGEEPHRLQRGLRLIATASISFGRHQRPGQVHHISAVIAVVGNPPRLADGLLVPGPDAARKARDLLAGIVVVVLAIDLPPGPIEHLRDRVAERCLPAVADVQRPRRIRRDELDHYWLPGAVLRASEGCAAFDDRAQPISQVVAGQAKVDEAGPCHLCRSDSGTTHVDP